MAQIAADGEKYVTAAQYRTTAAIAFVACLIGAFLFLLYGEKRILSRITELKIIQTEGESAA